MDKKLETSILEIYKKYTEIKNRNVFRFNKSVIKMKEEEEELFKIIEKSYMLNAAGYPCPNCHGTGRIFIEDIKL